MSWIIEFTGLPGSGKSTLVNTFSDDNRFLAGRDAANRTITAARGEGTLNPAFAWLLIRHFRLALSLGRFMFSARSVNRDSLRRVRLILKIVDRIRHLRSINAQHSGAAPEFVLLDQGIYQELMSICYPMHKLPSEPSLYSVLNKLAGKGADILAYTQAPVDVARQRVNERQTNESRFDVSEALTHELEEAEDLVKRIVNASEACGVKVLRLDASAGTAACKKQFEHELERLRHG